MQSPTDNKARFSITMGSVDGIRILDKHDVYIDDIELIEITKDEYDKLIKEPIIFADGSALYITSINFEVKEGVVSNLYLNGYYLYN